MNSTVCGDNSNRNDNDNDWRTIHVGLTRQGLDRMGDVVDVTSASAATPGARPADDGRQECQHNLARGDAFLSVSWEGHRITSADELYHTVWDNVEGVTRIETPVPCQRVQVTAIDCHQTEVDEDDVLATMVATSDEWNRAVQSNLLISETEYNARQRPQQPTAFSQVEGLV